MRHVVVFSLALSFLLISACGAASKHEKAGKDHKDWQSSVEGTYTGFIFSGGVNSPAVTTIERDDKGNFIGSYEFMEKESKVTGTLYQCHIPSTTDRELSCKWRDKYGKGDLSMSFNDSVTEFTGGWSAEGKKTKHPWNGSKAR